MNAIFFQIQSEIIESLFGLEWLKKEHSKNHNHPAITKWVFSRKLAYNNGIIENVENLDVLKMVTSVILDNFNIVSCSRDKDKELKLGSFLEYGNEKVRKKIHSVIFSYNGFNSLLTEFSFAAWHIDNGYDIHPYEENGWPDFRVNYPNTQIPTFIDCKKISANSSDNRYGKVIQKANKQIKKPNEDCFGLVVIDITSKVSQTSSDNNKENSQIEKISKLVSKCLLKHNTSVSAVLLYWDKYNVFDNGKKESVYTALTRNSKLLKHANPINKLPDDFLITKFGLTVEIFLKKQINDRIILQEKHQNISRNSMCHCNSGKKFKKCCGKPK